MEGSMHFLFFNLDDWYGSSIRKEVIKDGKEEAHEKPVEGARVKGSDLFLLLFFD